MRKIYYHFSVLLITTALFSSCKKDVITPETSETINSTYMAQGRACGTAIEADMWNYGLIGGKVSITNDETNVYVAVSTADPAYKLKTIRIAYGSINHLTFDINSSWDNLIGITNPDILVNVSPLASTYTVTIPRTNISTSCINLSVHALVTDGISNANDFGMWINPINIVNSYAWSSYLEYCVQACPPPPPTECGQLRTQTPGGWGAVPHGNNPGTYLHANFNAAFPQGLTIGCAPVGYSIVFTNPQAITDLLPTGGTAKALTDNALNPSNPAAYKNVLISHITALSLSVGFDDADANFGFAPVRLGDMKIGSGTFANMTVRNFLDLANKILGGCNNTYTPKQINDAAAKINENYVDGRMDNGFVVCPL